MRPGPHVFAWLAAAAVVFAVGAPAGAQSGAGDAPAGAAGAPVTTSDAPAGPPGARAGAAARPRAQTSCVTCHSDAEMFVEQDLAIVESMRADVHAAAGLSCQDCHGGDPDPALADDPDAAMDPEGEPAFRGVPTRAEIPSFCGRCHSDPAFMRRFRPDQRVDQEQEYLTSRHGLGLARGDENVATCVDCHGVHGIRGPGDLASPVHPKRVADTCGRCHSDPKRMAGYHRDDGAPLPTDQRESWRQSVHAAAMLEKGDLSAPTCNDCHGNHGAVPPGVGSLSFVCGQCHGREAELFRASAKREGFEAHNEYLADAGEEGCAACHDSSEPQAKLVGMHSFGECTTCHDNHGVVTPRVTMLGPPPAAPCALCHEPNQRGEAIAPEPAERNRNYVALRDQLLAEAEQAGLAGAARFDWLIDRARRLPPHTDLQEDGTRQTRPEFERLFTKFRLGKTTVAVRDPTTGAHVRKPLRQCADCHGSGELTAGMVAATGLRDRMQELTTLIARAERIVLDARRGGVPVGAAAEQIDAAVDAQIQLQVLVHTFDPEGAFGAKHREGIRHASVALAEGQKALDELRFRYRGLVMSLGAIALVLVGLWLKIRSLPAG